MAAVLHSRLYFMVSNNNMVSDRKLPDTWDSWWRSANLVVPGGTVKLAKFLLFNLFDSLVSMLSNVGLQMAFGWVAVVNLKRG